MPGNHRQVTEKLDLTPHTVFNFEALAKTLHDNHWRVQDKQWTMENGKYGWLEWWNKGANFVLVYVFDGTAIVMSPLLQRKVSALLRKTPKNER